MMHFFFLYLYIQSALAVKSDSLSAKCLWKIGAFVCTKVPVTGTLLCLCLYKSSSYWYSSLPLSVQKFQLLVLFSAFVVWTTKINRQLTLSIHILSSHFFLLSLHYKCPSSSNAFNLASFSLPVTNLTLRRLMSYIYGAPILDVSRSHTTTQHSR